MVKHKNPNEPNIIKRFPHIDGLRGLAIALVVIFHLFVGKVSAGVDVFLFVGGLVFVRSALKHSRYGGGWTFWESIVRTFRRLSPPMILVVLTTLVGYLLIYPQTKWGDFLTQASASVLYVINWLLAFTGLSYTKASSGVSPLQHLWSMSAQFQIYVVLLALVYIVARVGKKFTPSRGKAKRKALTIVLAVFSLASFAYANYMLWTGAQSTNYYSSLSRFWEIGFGAIIGLWVNRLVFTPLLRRIFSLVGLVMIGASGVFLDGTNQFPAYWALIPILGALLVVLAGITYPKEKRTVSTIGIAWIFDHHPFRFLGKISYSLYLWHWAIFILAMEATGRDFQDPYLGVGVIALSIPLAWLTQQYIENYFAQHNKPPSSHWFSTTYLKIVLSYCTSRVLPYLTVILIFIWTMLATSPVVYKGIQGIQDMYTARKIEAAGGYSENYPGAQFIYSKDKTLNTSLPVQPTPTEFPSMLPQTQADGCFTDFAQEYIALNNREGNPCGYGDTSSQKTLYVVGGSHSEQYIGALDTIGKNRGIKVIPLVKMGCPLYQNERFDGKEYPECMAWSERVEKYIDQNPPTEGMVMISSRMSSVYGDGPEVTPDFYTDVFTHFADQGIHIFAIRDNPWFTQGQGKVKDVRDCVSKTQDYASCGEKKSDVLQPQNPAIKALGNHKNIQLIDFTDLFSNGDWLPVVTGNVLMYRDAHHITRQYMDTMTPFIEQRMFE